MVRKGSEAKLASSVGLLVREIRALLTAISESKTEVENLKERLDYEFEASASGLPERIEAIEGFLKEVFPKKED